MYILYDILYIYIYICVYVYVCVYMYISYNTCMYVRIPPPDVWIRAQWCQSQPRWVGKKDVFVHLYVNICIYIYIYIYLCPCAI